MPLKMTYGAIEGSERLRRAIASLYAKAQPDDILVTHGAIGANALVYAALVEPGDEIVSLVPTYQQHVAIPRSYGAAVKCLQLKPEDGYLPDPAALAALVTPKTRLIALTNPNNPTGARIDRSRLMEIVAVAAANDVYLLCDEVYRGVDQDGDAMQPSIADLYGKGIAIGSMSKAFALAGLRLGWIVAPRAVLDRVMIHRDYTTISVGRLDDYIATLALEHCDALLARNRKIVRDNLAILDAWVKAEPMISYIRPSGGTVCLLKYESNLASRQFCRQLIEDCGVLLMPGSALAMEGQVRIGFGNATDVLREGLQATSGFLARLSA
jgi:aspartate/methionine/tyrosine aminotransferase